VDEIGVVVVAVGVVEVEGVMVLPVEEVEGVLVSTVVDVVLIVEIVVVEERGTEKGSVEEVGVVVANVVEYEVVIGTVTKFVLMLFVVNVLELGVVLSRVAAVGVVVGVVGLEGGLKVGSDAMLLSRIWTTVADTLGFESKADRVMLVASGGPVMDKASLKLPFTELRVPQRVIKAISGEYD
jgi:hypothetical protein